MLRTLTLRDFVIVDRLEIDLSPDFTVLSGETGAGKSILIDALALALGERADASVVREGAERADICAEFTVPSEVEAMLAAQDLSNDGVVLMRRTIDRAGRSKSWINGAPATLAQLRELGDQLVDIHGQHAHQSLLRTDAQRVLLDSHAHLEGDVGAVAERYRQWQALRRQREALESDAGALREERERLTWQTQELEKLKLQAGEWDAIQEEHQRLSNAAELIAGAQQALDALSETDDALLTQLASIIHRLEQLQSMDRRLGDVLEALIPARINIEEALRSLNDYASRIDLDPQRLAVVESRIEALHASARKFRVTPDALGAIQSQLLERLAALQGLDDPAALRAEENAAEAAYRTRAGQLTAARRTAAAALSTAVTEAMQSLSMPGGRFAAVLVPKDASANGSESIEFQVAAHPGVSLRPLAKVASGGELARISLAIAVIASSSTSVPTLIFDEVDSGIGGAVAEVVGRLLRQLGKTRQVLCVTHLAQVAAQGDAHFCVAKEQVDGATLSRIFVLKGAARTDEIARMLGGIEITATTRKHARELLAQAS